ncbi:MAG: LacI family DNA-binding transcriptional regulator [Anaerolineales bacterium]|nr:LacI family DNA-binding transcriptional regulator [Anaerolineales bacterium]
MPATIYDVATHAGVSISTVSRVVNSPQGVNPATRFRVQRSIEALGFVPRADATARARRLHRQVGVLAPFFTYSAFVQRLRGIASSLSDAGYELVVYNADTPEHIHAYLHSLPLLRRLDGLIIISLRLDDMLAVRLRASGLPVALIEATHPSLSGVDVDNREGGRVAGKYLMAAGHRQIGFVGGDYAVGDYTLRTSQLRLQGLCEVAEAAGVQVQVPALPANSATREDAQQQAFELLARSQPPTAIFAASDTLALGVLRAARERNLRVPQDLAVLGFDDLEFAEYIGLSTISQSLEVSGRQAVELVMAAMADEQTLPRHVQLPLHVVRRETA